MTTNKPAPRKRTPKPVAQPATPQEVPLRLNLVLVADGKVVAVAREEGQISAPEPGQGVTINWSVDARKVRTLLEECLGPEDTGKPASKLWTPDTAAVKRTINQGRRQHEQTASKA